MIDITEMKYPALKSECAKLGLDAKGTKEELSERLEQYRKGREELKQFVAQEDMADQSLDEIKPQGETKGQIAASHENDQRKLEADTSLQSLLRQIEIIFAGRASYSIEENSPGNHSIIFRGGGRKAENINLSAPHSLIKRMAIQYVGRTVIDRGPQSLEEAKKNPR